MDKNRNKSEAIKEAIFRVVSFFDIFDFPLTAFEIWKYLSLKAELLEVEENLEELVRSGKLISQNNFFCLNSREKIIETRLKRYNYAERKFKKAKTVSKIFKFIPWIKLVAVGNLIGTSNLRDEGDIDFFIIAQRNRLWLTRLFSTVLMKLAAQRPTPGNEKDKICLSFYVSENNLNLENLSLNKEDWYFIYWLINLEPIYDKGGVYEDFINNNAWVHLKVPNWKRNKKGTRHEIKPLLSNIYTKVWDLFFYPFERSVYKFQMNRFPLEIKRLANQDSRVVINEEIIKLHTNDRRAEFLNNFNKITSGKN